MTGHHLVVGAGAVGTATAQLLAERGEQVRIVSRSGRGPQLPTVERISADAGDAARIGRLAEGATAVYNCLNPQYHRWPTDWPPMATALLSAAERSGAVLATVGNLYPYGPVDGPMTEDLPDSSTGTKARVRARMWADAKAAHDAGRVRAVEVRGSDYVGPGEVQGHLNRVLPRVLAGKPVRVVPSADQPHTWTYTPDVARLLVTVAADERAWGRVWHVPSGPPRTQREALTDLATAAGREPVAVRELPRLAIRAAGLVVPMMREMAEVAYQHERPYVLDSSAATATFGVEPTPWSEVCAATVAGRVSAAAS